MGSRQVTGTVIAAALPPLSPLLCLFLRTCTSDY